MNMNMAPGQGNQKPPVELSDDEAREIQYKKNLIEYKKERAQELGELGAHMKKNGPPKTTFSGTPIINDPEESRLEREILQNSDGLDELRFVHRENISDLLKDLDRSDPFYGLPDAEKKLATIFSKSMDMDRALINRKNIMIEDLEEHGDPSSLEEAQKLRTDIQTLQSELHQSQKKLDLLKKKTVPLKIDEIEATTPGLEDVLEEEKRETEAARAKKIADDAIARASEETSGDTLIQNRQDGLISA